MTEIKFTKCDGCGEEKETVSVFVLQLCFDCMEPLYQALAAAESRKLSVRWAS